MNTHNCTPGPVLLTKRDVTKICSVSLRTVDSWIRRNIIGYVKLGGGAVRFTPADIESFIQKYRINEAHR